MFTNVQLQNVSFSKQSNSIANIDFFTNEPYLREPASENIFKDFPIDKFTKKAVIVPATVAGTGILAFAIAKFARMPDFSKVISSVRGLLRNVVRK